MARGNAVYFAVGMDRVPEMELLPEDVEEEWSPEDMEEAEEEVQTIIDQYYGQTKTREEGR